MAPVSRTIHTFDESGNLVTIRAGEEVPEGVEPQDHWFDNSNADDLASLTEEEFFVAADANGTVSPEDTGGAGEGDDDFGGVTVPQLRAYAQEVDVDLAGARTRAQIVSALTAADVDPDDVREWAEDNA